jgi:short-subunit dehydrogenase
MSVALITGAGRGIGRGIAVGLAHRGYALCLTSRSADELAEAADECSAHGAAVITCAADVCDTAAMGRTVADVETELGGIDLLVNNAGRIERSPLDFADADLEDAWDVVRTNLRGPMVVSRAVLPGMIARGRGRIVNINSGSAHRVGTYYTGYYVSKGALARFTSQLASQLADRAVRVFDLAPGSVATALSSSMPNSATRTEWTPLQATVDLVAAVAEGRLDALTGRFLHADTDSVDSLLRASSSILSHQARVLALTRYGQEDPLRS